MTVMIMPRLGETVTEGTVTKWYKREGDRVEKDEIVLEISTDKVDTEIPAPISGTIAKILVAENATVPVETELAVIEEEPTAVKESRPVEPETKLIPSKKIEEKEVVEIKKGMVISPLVRKLARDHKIDPAAIEGTGTGGRVTKKDILSFIEISKTLPPTEKPTYPPPVRPESENGEKRIPLSQMRKAIAEHMVRSRHTAAHVTTVVEVNMHKIALLREPVKERFKKEEGFSLTFLPFVARAVIDALQKYPQLNSSLEGDEIVIKKAINLGIAVAIPDGLIVPVIKHAETKSLIGLAREIRDLSERARDRRLKPDEVHEGTFTITNPGGFGSIIQTPIINQPQVGILSLEKVEKRPVVIDDAIAIRWMVYLPLSYDHRVLDGAVAASFLAQIKTDLEEWDFTPELGY